MDILNILLRYGLWFFSVLILLMTARVLRGKHRYTTTLRAAGFAQSAHVLGLFTFVPVIGKAMPFLATLLTVFGVWLGVATGNELKGWRSIFLPVLYQLLIGAKRWLPVPPPPRPSEIR